ncbi:GT2 family glycosyltransferase [Algoriphagus boseongensis]|uniref:GT2 family glycosyltransferase n=1 Tax=Algoriphagus boseongensis TaxID=1442587 RepID=A0A4R6TBE8_9BACT|nr:glycosyltransferase [Algoriphagus boseongensis]TDQ19573.1 GT2 family glycosyltransferase [Algoriphagus boseongensis]
MRFGGFVITYNRPEIVLDTLEKLFAQTHPPELIWVIDNSENLETDHAIASLLNPKIKYFRMGYNAGPAGAAMKGLQLCTQDGLDWILWADDNDPPFFSDTFEKLLTIRNENPFCGIIGAVGHFFDRKKGVIKRIQSRLLEKKEIIEVDCIAGNMSMIINAQVVKQGILPNPDLFFGFEELDFCLKASRRGFTLLVPAKLFLRLRNYHNRVDFERPIYSKKRNHAREYYSLRNLLIISDCLTLNTMRNRLIGKWLGKMVYGFRYGPSYGLENAKMIFLAFFHYYRGIKGKTLSIS